MQMEVQGFTIHEKIYSGNSLVFDATKDSDSSKVILKFPASEYPTPSEIGKLKQEFSIGKRLVHQGIVKYKDLVSYRNGFVIVMDKAGEITLASLLKQKSLTLAEFLSIAISLCDTFHYIHLQGIIHKDIKPENIILNSVNHLPQVIDFGIASDVGRDMESVISTNVVAGTLAYISPEQTGRMNRSVDNRSDIYSLGITFYEMLAGKLPFITTDSLEMLHFHMARPAPSIKKEGVPPILNKIIQKMILKNPEERYKSCLGIQKDLQYIQDCIVSGKALEEIVLGEKDYSTTLLIPEKLYGREDDIGFLNSVFEEVVKGNSQLLLVSGYSGIGKSGLIREVQKPLVAEKGYFISGKFDQFQKNVPYKGLILAFQDLISQLLASNKTVIQDWRERILNALQGNGKVLTDVVPDLELLIGKQPDLAELDPMQSQNRFNLVFENFIRCIASPANPLVLFLDDLQWADISSLHLLELIFSGTDIRGLMVIGAFRDNEVDASHPLQITIQNISKSGTIPPEIKLSPLSLEDITEFVSDSLVTNQETSLKLAKVLHSKTGGNPFFLKMLLQNMYVSKFINQDRLGHWIVDFDQIYSMQITDNVIDLAVKKINSTSGELREILSFGSSIGYIFELDMISLLFGKSREELISILKEGLKEELINKQEDGEKIHYRFVHDRIQQAYYSLLTEKQIIDFHYKIGKHIHSTNSEAKQEEFLFEITDHLNKAITILEKKEVEDLLHLNLKAGRKAKASSAYQSAQIYLQFAIECLEKLSTHCNVWEIYYKESIEAYSEGAEIALLATDIDKMLKLSEIALANSKQLLDKVRIFEIKINYHSQINDLETAVSTAATILTELGVTFPEKARPPDIFSYLFKAKLALGRKTSQDIFDLKKIESPELAFGLKINMSACSAAYFTSAEMLTCMILRGVALSAKNGNTNSSIYFYAGYGLILCGALFDFKNGNEFADLAMKLLDKFQAEDLRCRVTFYHWMHNLQNSLQPLLDAYSTGLQNGDLEYAAGALLFHKMYALNLGEELEKLEKETRSANAQMLKTKQLRNRNTNLILHQVMLNLLGESSSPDVLKGESYDAQEGLKKALEIKDMMAASWILLYQAQLQYFFGKKEEALKSITECDKYEPGILAQYLVVLKNFYSSLILLANITNVKTQKGLLKKVKSNQKKLKSWGKSFNENIEHKYLLVEAEIARVTGKYDIAIDLYDKAILASEANGFINENALANELAGNFYLFQKKNKFANLYFSEAKFRYLQWGAKAKVKELDERIPNLFEASRKYKTTSQTISTGGTTIFSETKNTTMALFDVISMMKAAQSISGEIQLEKLLEKLINLAVEYAGAEKGFLILIQNGQMSIQAYMDIVTEKVEVLTSLPVANFTPESILNYTINKREPQVLINASRIGNFTKDDFIVKNQTLSVLCVPLINQGKLNGLIYLENNKTAGAFTPDRVEVLRTLSSQASISIENALLYDNLSSLNKAYERFVPKQFLETLGKNSVVEVQLGDNVRKKATIFFSDIRSFTTLSEQMTPEENFKFINSYLKYMEPVINRHSGFIDKYIGDAIMALFPTNANDAVTASIEMQKALREYNSHRSKRGYVPIEVGMGLNTGDLILGTVGGEFRMDGTVISDSVNLASRIEGLTKYYGASIIISETTFNDLQNPQEFTYRFLGQVRVKGKAKGIGIIEILDGKSDEELSIFSKSINIFNESYKNYTQAKFKEALSGFEEVIKINLNDKAAKLYKERAIYHIQNGVPENWDGIDEMESK